ncbi:Xaa-Pro aminopeptidase 1 [Aphelenchoides bicaudatus]|nr:Xaa-Pro aminopeptidase 1 [Aphelenchoides bicaudatus]
MSSLLQSFRALFAEAGIVGQRNLDFYVLPRTDYHNSEYIAAQDERVKFLSGFSGSNAYTIIGKDDAFLWTDGRYFDQAAKELTSGWTLMKDGTPGVLSPGDWLIQKISPNSVVGFDPHLFGYDTAVDLLQKLKKSKAIAVPITRNLVDVLWDARPKPTIKNLMTLTKEDAGEDIPTKLKRVREEYAKKKCESIIIGDLAEIAWLFNLRGSDIPFNPVFFSIAVVDNNSAHLFIDEHKIDSNILDHLGDVKIHAYESILTWLEIYHANAKKSNPEHKVWITSSTNYAWGSLIGDEYAYVDFSPIQFMKAIRDAGALVQFFNWLETEIKNGSKISEKQASDKSFEFRTKVSKFVSLSFDTISAVGGHASFPHYHMTEESGKVLIDPDNVYLLDSGGQYRDGTTDVTRTVVLGTPSKHVKRMFTLVLKGHINNARLIVPDRINAMRLDSSARQFLWQYGYDFGHGVGHGVGHFLNVHEFPPSIGYRQVNQQNVLKRGTIVTIEPGYYDTNNFGIRIENGYEMVEATGLESKAGNYLAFRSLTWVPIQASLIDKDLLTKEEVITDWLNDYHKTCLEKTGAYLKEQGLNNDYAYLEQACKPL